MYTITEAIADSIRENRIVHLSASIDSQEWVDLANALLVEGEDYAELADFIGKLREYWGTDEDGDAWRIHLHANDV